MEESEGWRAAREGVGEEEAPAGRAEGQPFRSPGALFKDPRGEGPGTSGLCF